MEITRPRSVPGQGVVPDASVRILRASVDTEIISAERVELRCRANSVANYGLKASVGTELSQQSTYSCVAGPAVLLTVDLKRP
jgi:hypothetical protein